jgi:hypothetical protein
MTIDRMTLKALVEKGCDDDQEMMTYVANRLTTCGIPRSLICARGRRLKQLSTGKRMEMPTLRRCWKAN